MIKTVVSSVVLFAVAALAVPTVSLAADLAVGSTAPALKLEAADGDLRSLASGGGAKVLIFYRGLW